MEEKPPENIEPDALSQIQEVEEEAKARRAKIFIIAALVALPLVSVVIFSTLKKPGESTAASGGGAITTLDWQALRELEIETGVVSPRLKALDGTKVKLPGFMVPLEDNRQEVSEFLLVPSPQACIHVPPPPANQMVLVHMTGDPTKMAWGPVWAEGILRISPGKHQYGTSSFQMMAQRTEPYKADF